MKETFKKRKYIYLKLLLLGLFITSLIANVLFIPLAIRFIRLGSPALFSLSDTGASYILKKKNSGEYIIEYRKNSEHSAAFVGSTRVSLEQFDNKPIRIIGQFRPILGFPLCYETCDEYLGNDETPVIDVEGIEIVQYNNSNDENL